MRKGNNTNFGLKLTHQENQGAPKAEIGASFGGKL